MNKLISPKEQAERPEQILRETVREELQRKSKLGQYAVAYKDGRALRVPAGELASDKCRK